MVLQIVLLVVGIALLVKGADWLVDGAGGLAKSFGVSPLFIGLTVVAFGTSAPELAVSMSAAIKGSGSIAISNAIGSNIANIALVIGFTSMLAPLSVSRSTVRKELPFCILLSLAVFAMLLRGPAYGLDRFDGIVLIIFLIIFMEYTLVMAKNDRMTSKISEKDIIPDQQKVKKERIKNLILTIVGLVMVVFGADVTVNAATKIALSLGISEALVGLSMVAIGTSLPELVTSLSAALKGQSDLAIGNIVGSNIFNIGLILGVSSLVNPISVSVNLYWVDILVMTLLTVALLFATLKRNKVTRVEGALFFMSYIGYITFIAIRG
ncbi:MAG TPA: calcium/sodium antiporter [Thermotogota bacterium]|nr:calcium/sodium antiporter [Thermotogota bacterium]HPJ88652.1 calcium/sodium antiporter [Thermotogota bacterium]HPR95810.1 calcium/sodium antiporter [Thermotogota bacterium]